MCKLFKQVHMAFGEFLLARIPVCYFTGMKVVMFYI